MLISQKGEFIMKEEINIENIKKAYYNKLIRSKTSVDDMMPLFTKAKTIFDVIKRGKIRRRRK